MFTDNITRVLSGIVCRQIWCCEDVSKHRGWNQVSSLLIKYWSSTRIVSKFLSEIVGGGVIIYIHTSVLIFITRFRPLRPMCFVRCMPLWVTYKEFLLFSLHSCLSPFLMLSYWSPRFHRVQVYIAWPRDWTPNYYVTIFKNKCFNPLGFCPVGQFSVENLEP